MTSEDAFFTNNGEDSGKKIAIKFLISNSHAGSLIGDI